MITYLLPIYEAKSKQYLCRNATASMILAWASTPPPPPVLNNTIYDYCLPLKSSSVGGLVVYAVKQVFKSVRQTCNTRCLNVIVFMMLHAMQGPYSGAWMDILTVKRSEATLGSSLPRFASIFKHFDQLLSHSNAARSGTVVGIRNKIRNNWFKSSCLVPTERTARSKS